VGWVMVLMPLTLLVMGVPVFLLLLATCITTVVSYCALSKRWLDSLPPDLREVVITESRAVLPRAVKISDEFNVSLTKKWEDRGGKINRLSDAEMKTVRERFGTVGTTITEGKPELRAFYNELRAVSEKTP